MNTETTPQPATYGEIGNNAPYPPSWVNLMIAWVRRLPLPAWLFYLGLWLIPAVIFNLLTWIEGSQKAGWFDTYLTTWGFFIVYYLGLMHYLDGVASRALENFRPALELSESEYSRLDFELTTTPARNALLAGLGGAAMTLLAFPFIPPTQNSSAAGSRFFAPLGFTTALLTNFVIGAFIYHSIRQLRIVSRIHKMVRVINLYQREPLHAFSVLTARTGIGIILAIILGVGPRSQTLWSQAIVDISIFFLPLAIATFALPLWSIHDLLVQEKKRVLASINSRLQAVLAESHQRVDHNQLNDMTNLKMSVDILVIERDLMVKIPTWPWKTGTLSGFLSAFSLPLIIYLLQQFLLRAIFPVR